MEDAFQQKLSGAAPHGERHTHCPCANHVVVDPDLMADALRAIDAILEEEDVAISRVLLPTSPTSANDDDDRSFHQTRREAAGVHYLRSWFLSNLAHPFPSRAERQKMASIASTTPRNVESSFTNWRRRSGWSAVRRKWGGQSRTGMRLLIQRYEARSLEPEASDAISKMRSYFANDKARSCIEEMVVSASDTARAPRIADTPTVTGCRSPSSCSPEYISKEYKGRRKNGRKRTRTEGVAVTVSKRRTLPANITGRTRPCSTYAQSGEPRSGIMSPEKVEIMLPEYM